MILYLISLASCISYLQQEEKSFISWMRSNNQFYIGDEYYLRFGIFLTNLRLIKEHNSANRQFQVGLNKFAVYTPSEYNLLLNQRKISTKEHKITKGSSNYPSSFDWRDQGIIFPIIDQAQCSSSWAIMAAEACEYAYKIKTGNSEEFSPQNLIDCVTYSYGCNGGDLPSAFDYVINKQNGSFCTMESYPYIAAEGLCLFNSCKKVGHLKSYFYSKGDEDDLAENVANLGPLVVTVDGSNWSFQLYTGGIYDPGDCSADNKNQNLLCIGYGFEGETKYWILQNTWGTSWGEKGTIRFIRGKNSCEIASGVPIVNID